MMNCKSCKAEIPTDRSGAPKQKFCSDCGAKVEELPPADPHAERLASLENKVTAQEKEIAELKKQRGLP